MINNCDNYSNGFELGYMFNRKYKYIEELKQRGQARVFLIEDTSNLDEKKLKILKMVENVGDEIDILKTIRDRSEHIIKYYDDFGFYGVKHCIVTEYCYKRDLNFILEQYKHQNVKIEESIIDKWNKQIVEGVCFLHENKIIHRDLKPQNIFVTEKDDLKIGDFGFSKKVYEILSKSRIVGTISYMSPEVLREKQYDDRIDTWSYGCVLYKIIFLKRLFNGENDFEIQKQILEQEIVIPDTKQKYRFILDECLLKEGHKRAHMYEIKRMIEDYENNQLDFKIISGEKNIFERIDCEIKIWDVKSGDCIQTLKGHLKTIRCMCLIDKTRLVSGSYDSTIRLWDLRSGDCIKTFRGHSNWINCITVLDKNTIISGSFDTTIKFWNIESGNCFKTLTGHSSWVRCFVLMENNKLISGSYDKTIKVWDLNNNNCSKTITGHTGWIICILKVDNNEIITGSYDQTIKVWNVETGMCLKNLTGHSETVMCISLLSKRILISGSYDKTIKIWDIIAGICLKTLSGHLNPIMCIKVKDNFRIVSGSGDKTIKVWDIITGECIKTLTGFSNSVNCILLVD